MKLLAISILVFALLGCGPREPEGTVVKPPETVAPSETGGSGVGTGVRKIGQIKKN